MDLGNRVERLLSAEVGSVSGIVLKRKICSIPSLVNRKNVDF
jgi:hypothetical protein